MNLVRVIVIVLGMTFVGGLFGALVGGLFGVAMPDSVSVFYETDRAVEDGADADTASSRRGAAIGVGQHRDEEMGPGARGAAFGGAFGLLLGALLGIPIALMDQFLATGASWLQRRHTDAQHGGPSGPIG